MSRVNQFTAEGLTQYQTLKGTHGTLQYVGVMLNGPQEELDAGLPMPRAEKIDVIFLDRVSFGYDPQQPVLHDLTLHIPVGKTTAIIGNNGSGKSTMLKLLQGIYQPDSGNILIGGVSIASIRPEELRSRFGYILQNNPLFSGTIRDNICYGCKKEISEADMIRAAKIACADEFIRELPNGYDTDVGEAGHLLSGGQRQRIAIARTIATAPDYLLMDEAGASLDHKSDTVIYRHVRKIMRGKTIIVVAHDMATVMDADYIIVLNQGSLEAAGTHKELLEKSPTYRGYLTKQGYILNQREEAEIR